MKRLADFRKKVIEGWTVQRIAAVLIVVSLVVFVIGIVNKHCTCAGLLNLGDTLNDVISDFYANVSVDCLSIAFTILVIDRLNERRAEKELKAQLIREMGSTDNGIAVRAVNELRASGWLEDGSLKGTKLNKANLQDANMNRVDLQRAEIAHANLERVNLAGANLERAALHGANLQRALLMSANLQDAFLMSADLQNAALLETDLRGAILWEANLQGANLLGANLQQAKLSEANLQGANLTNEQLASVSSLWGATMPDGSRYNGCFNLEGDNALAVEYHVNLDDPEAVARFYEVSIEESFQDLVRKYPPRRHRIGGFSQEWAREHLADLRREAGLDPDTGLPVEPANGVEPQPTDAPAAPAPRRNAHKATPVAHQVRR
jgi:Pentapeptide repeats (8 copies)